MKHLITIIVFIFIANSVEAQQQRAELIQDKKVDLLVEKHAYLYRHNFTLTGWRIQIFFDSGVNSKRKASDVLRQFTELHPDVQAYLSFKEPYYRVRVGDFRSRLEAEGFLKKLQISYPNAFATSDLINPPNIE